MIIYNVTTHIHNSIHEPWLAWMKQTHIPEVMVTGCFTEFKLVRLLETDDTEGPTYAVQYYATNRADYEKYLQAHAAKMRNAGITLWGDKMIAFRSLMEIVN